MIHHVTSRYGLQGIGSWVWGTWSQIFLGEELPVLAQGDSVELSTRVYLGGHELGPIPCWELELGVE